MPDPLSDERMAEIDKVISLGVLAKRGRHIMAACDLRAEVTRLREAVTEDVRLLEEGVQIVKASERLIANYQAEVERLRTKTDWYETRCVNYGTFVSERDATIDRLRVEVQKWQRIRTPTHGTCCTCQACGENYDDCRCDLDDVADRAAVAEAEVERLRKALKEQMLNQEASWREQNEEATRQECCERERHGEENEG